MPWPFRYHAAHCGGPGELFGSGDLSRERGSRCSRASRVGENVGVGHGRILQEAAEFLHITLFLAGEPDDDVAAESHDGPESVDFFHCPEEGVHGIMSPSHAPEYALAGVLQGNVEVGGCEP